MHFFENLPLTSRNTLGLPSRARFFAAPESDAELLALLDTVTLRNLPLMVLGGGSNVVFAADFPGLVLQPSMRGMRCIAETADHYLVEAAAGEKWPELVQYTLQQHWYGLENLSLIPGTAGAAPIQNIGAYGVELTDRFHSLTAVEIATGKVRDFSHEECRFGYRESVFKQELRDRFIIMRIRLRLQKKPAIKIEYGDIRQELAARDIADPTPQQVSDVVSAIRRRKLPQPSELGNAGSFFKNPVVPQAMLEKIRAEFPEVVSYPQGDNAKLAAGWLIERAGWKGRRLGAAGCYEKQALVLVNHGNATGADVLALAHAIRNDVQAMFGVELEMEPRIYGV